MNENYEINKKYVIEEVEIPTGYIMFPLNNVTFIKSYIHYGKTSLVFRYNLNYNDYFEWGCCWFHIASNHIILDNSINEQYLIETHIYDFKIKKINPVIN